MNKNKNNFGYWKPPIALLTLALATGLASPTVHAAVSCKIDDVKAKVEGFSKNVSSQEKGFKDEHAKSTSSDYSKNHFSAFDNLNKNAKEAHNLITTGYDLAARTKLLKEGQIQNSLPPKVTNTMSNAVELAQAALNEKNTRLDLAIMRCAQSTEDTALSAYLDQAGSSAKSNYKDTKRTACKLVQLLADLQDKQNKLNDIRKDGYPLFFLHASKKHQFAGTYTRTIQLKVDLRMLPEYPEKPVHDTKLNGQPLLLGQLTGIDLSYNSYFKFSDNNWTKLNLFQYIISDTSGGRVCPVTVPVSGSVKARLCIEDMRVHTDKITVKVGARFNYNNDWKYVGFGTQTIPAPFGYLADVSDMKEKKMQDLKAKLADRVISLLGDYGDMIETAQQWQKACSS
ncbi:hypothetical protein FM042_00905 [Aliidiomarina halalkaliphila]|uniref:Uncharacterized protein n=1 Tax=Aliidiomarina halalkaliphila TaxID=2593535 RepID=A0A552X3C0_9GAMM|nr:hypothetical protein [Aliidiomarina halalkaliphila]TRW49456.1 hypothetical protein FM042_00905 [Aliidiomarina halalkaliphila]